MKNSQHIGHTVIRHDINTESLYDLGCTICVIGNKRASFTKGPQIVHEPHDIHYYSVKNEHTKDSTLFAIVIIF